MRSGPRVPSATGCPLDYSGFDQSFDTVWNSEGRLTSQGYMLLMAIPFKSLRFPKTDPQQWRIILNRSIPAHQRKPVLAAHLQSHSGTIQSSGECNRHRSHVACSQYSAHSLRTAARVP